LLVAFGAILAAGCGGGGGNVNAPRGNAIGDRHHDFMRVIAHAKTLPPGDYTPANLPPELRLKNLLTLYVGRPGVYALEFPSHPIDSDPIYVFVEEGVPDPEGAVRALCRDHAAWRFGRKLDEPGWYYLHGP
jgi:hypothetical protein